ncbi:hypothetical protein FRB99_001971 [Tulasnella sp. 403]|nr:hypothetical protein FRB99_001971 [Tulasnella sp. 403]
MSETTQRLTKKQSKSLAHRDRRHAKRQALEKLQPLPEQDGDEHDGTLQAGHQAEGLELGVSLTPKPLKRKRGHTDTPGEQPVTASAKRPKLVDDKIAASTPKKATSKYILFIGNLAYATTREAIAAHFTQSAGAASSSPPTVRLLSRKGDSISKGCAFVEFKTSIDLQNALRLHHSELDGRMINVEMTAGGGGKKGNRTQKIVAKNKILERERGSAADKRPLPPPGYGVSTLRHSNTSGLEPPVRPPPHQSSTTGTKPQPSKGKTTMKALTRSSLKS